MGTAIAPCVTQISQAPRVEQLLQRRRQLLTFPVACKLLFQRRRAEIRAEQLQEQLQWLKVPVLVLQGAEDKPTVSLLGQTYAQLAPDATLQQFPGGNTLLETQPDEVAQAIRSFVEKHLNAKFLAFCLVFQPCLSH
jgi:pimeloyl-ACP methyl ester carboxylesterase